MPIVSREYTKNLDVNLARRMDDFFTYFNLQRKGFHGNSNEEWEQKILFIRDSFRNYWQSVEAQWEGYEPEDFDKTLTELEEACKMMGEVWADLWW